MIRSFIKKQFKSGFKWTLKLGLLLIIGMTILSNLTFDQVKNVNQSIVDMSFIFLLVRWSFFIAFMIYWKSIVNFLAKKQVWSETHKTNVFSQRWQVVVFFLLLELLFNHRTYLALLEGL